MALSVLVTKLQQISVQYVRLYGACFKSSASSSRALNQRNQFSPETSTLPFFFLKLAASSSMRLLFSVITGAAVCKMMSIPSAELLKTTKMSFVEVQESKIITEALLCCQQTKKLQQLTCTNAKHVIFAAKCIYLKKALERSSQKQLYQ